MSEIEALVSSSDGLFASNRRLDALIEAIKAKRKTAKLGGQMQILSIKRKYIATSRL